MGYWRSNAPLIWADSSLAIFEASRFTIVDGGAAGEIFEPFDTVLDSCQIYTFEPRGSETIDYEAKVNIDAGLWNEPSRRMLHVAAGPKASSIYPPNMPYLARFPSSLGGDVRETAAVVEVPLTSIDAEVGKGVMPKPNFIKLDIHSAEYEALLGSLNSLDDCLGLLVETWYAPVHTGQHLNGEVEVLLQREGFQLYDSRQSSAWPHALDNEKQLPVERRQLVGAESLFLRETPPPHLWAQHLALLELFGYTLLAIQITNQMLSGALEHSAPIERVEAVRAALLKNHEERVRIAREERQRAKQARLEVIYKERREAKHAQQMAKLEKLNVFRRKQRVAK
ncbi:MAG: FkbM family methyltransferase [Pelagibacterium sp.]|uniref:FkbM family methyltransferase n=1 Tax=Pelagibacterium sp. TaxID=1967288 RepID=UPI0032EB5C1E